MKLMQYGVLAFLKHLLRLAYIMSMKNHEKNTLREMQSDNHLIPVCESVLQWDCSSCQPSAADTDKLCNHPQATPLQLTPLFSQQSSTVSLHHFSFSIYHLYVFYRRKKPAHCNTLSKKRSRPHQDSNRCISANTPLSVLYRPRLCI